MTECEETIKSASHLEGLGVYAYLITEENSSDVVDLIETNRVNYVTKIFLVYYEGILRVKRTV